MHKSSAFESVSTEDAVLNPQKFTFSDITESLKLGWRTLNAMPGPSMAFAAVFGVIDAVILAMLWFYGLSPMLLPFAGGFMLIGPALLTGFFRLAVLHETNSTVQIKDAFKAFLKTPASIWLVAMVCALLFLIWITDSAVLYVIMIGGEDAGYDLSWLARLDEDAIRFAIWGSLIGSVLAFIIFSISAFSVPLLYERRANLIRAIHASVRAVFGNLFFSLVWGIVLTGVTSIAIIFPPLFLLFFPALAYASFSLYRKVFPGEALIAEKN